MMNDNEKYMIEGISICMFHNILLKKKISEFFEKKKFLVRLQLYFNRKNKFSF